MSDLEDQLYRALAFETHAHIAERMRLREKIEHLRAALRRHGKHLVECYLNLGCRCGLDAALADKE